MSLFNAKIKTTISPNGDVCLETLTEPDSLRDALSRYIIRTENQAIREALINLGWTPPKPAGVREEVEVPAVSRLPDHIVRKGLALAKGATIYGVEMNKMSHNELVAVAALGWNAFSRECRGSRGEK